MEDNKTYNKREKAKRYARSTGTVAVGAGAVLVAGYLVSRLKERQTAEASLARLEQMIDGLAAPAAEQM